MGDERLRELGGELRAMRTAAGLSGRELARRAGIAQSAVSRVENGQRVGTPAIVEKFVAALPIAPEVADGLRTRVRDAYAALADHRVDVGVSLKPNAPRRWERGTAPVREFQSAVIPRALRSPEYARAAGLAESPLAQPAPGSTRVFRCVITEGALRTWPDSGTAMPGQLDRILAADDLPSVHLSVIPWQAPVPVVPPHGFTVFGDEAVVVETYTAVMTLTKPGVVASYRDAHARLEEAAITGEPMRELLRRIRRDLAKLTG
ncbi:Scr1 family TA system antitoxin-like transcriptional regulator [Streptomonospora nanhaiensis]|uniref:Scr1 family TA system antitoxin-like transcriptional regulator n=1 Tax=Streptomonospora nanhaiensis TaxID=1323731 RepID=UPI001C394A36|nr:Scr1 family TA system antitoxin-like transcriptional regulator [Streptomonospora nanhaiensis]MBV2363471.1 helix-turn-helix transcriptional regulator [Streptomonospora nanhaiensis]